MQSHGPRQNRLQLNARVLARDFEIAHLTAAA